MSFHCPSHSVCGSLLWQPQQTRTAPGGGGTGGHWQKGIPESSGLKAADSRGCVECGSVGEPRQAGQAALEQAGSRRWTDSQAAVYSFLCRSESSSCDWEQLSVFCDRGSRGRGTSVLGQVPREGWRSWAREQCAFVNLKVLWCFNVRNSGPYTVALL